MYNLCFLLNPLENNPGAATDIWCQDFLAIEISIALGFVFCGLLISGRKKIKIQPNNLLQAQTPIWVGMDQNRLEWPVILFEGERGVSHSSLCSGKVLTILVGTQLAIWLVI